MSDPAEEWDVDTLINPLAFDKDDLYIPADVALCFMLRGHPPSCRHWQKWAQSGNTSWCKVIVHCDKCDALPVCGPLCILQGAERVESVLTTWGGPGVIAAESLLYKRAFSDPFVKCAALLTDYCVPVYDSLTMHRKMLSRYPLSRVKWSTDKVNRNRFGIKAELQKIVDRSFAQEWCQAADKGPTKDEIDSHIECVRQMMTGQAATNEQNIDEVTCIRQIVSLKGKAWLKKVVICEHPTLSVFDGDESHRSIKIDLNMLEPRFFRRNPNFLFARKVEGVPPKWYPLKGR